MPRLVLAALTALAVVLVSAAAPPEALAVVHYYASNTHFASAGVRADIRTPGSTPDIDTGAIANYVSNVDSHDGGKDWVQVGWCQGDGSFKAMDGTVLPTSPSSYREARIDSFYDYDAYSAQPLGFTRPYECVNVDHQPYWEWCWRTVISGTARGDYWGFAQTSTVVAQSEIINGYYNQCMAGFSNVQYKLTSYANFDDDNRYTSGPFTLIWYYPYKYSTHANGL